LPRFIGFFLVFLIGAHEVNSLSAEHSHANYDQREQRKACDLRSSASALRPREKRATEIAILSRVFARTEGEFIDRARLQNTLKAQ